MSKEPGFQIPPETAGSLVRNVLQGLTSYSDLMEKDPTIHVPAHHLDFWCERLHKVLRLVEEV